MEGPRRQTSASSHHLLIKVIAVDVAFGANAPGPCSPVLRSIEGTSVGAHTCARCIAARLISGVAYESFAAVRKCAHAANVLLARMSAAYVGKRGITSSRCARTRPSEPYPIRGRSAHLVLSLGHDNAGGYRVAAIRRTRDTARVAILTSMELLPDGRLWRPRPRPHRHDPDGPFLRGRSCVWSSGCRAPFPAGPTAQLGLRASGPAAVSWWSSS